MRVCCLHATTDAWLDSIDVTLRVKGGKARQGRARRDPSWSHLSSRVFRTTSSQANGENDGGRPWIGTVEHSGAGAGRVLPVPSSLSLSSSSWCVTLAVTLPKTPSLTKRTDAVATGSLAATAPALATAAMSSSIPTSPRSIVPPHNHSSHSPSLIWNTHVAFSHSAHVRFRCEHALTTIGVELLAEKTSANVVLFSFALRCPGATRSAALVEVANRFGRE